MANKILLGVDPGRSKTGLALVDTAGKILDYRVVLMTDFPGELREFISGYTIHRCVMGNGTTSASMTEILQKLLAVPITVIEEAHSTEEARKLYWELNPPQGLRKLLPTGMQVPPINLDGLAAVVLVKRYVQNTNKKTIKNN